VENYIHTLTHEMKTPLSAIKGAAELLQEQMTPGEREKFLRNILEESGRLQDLVSRMLDLAVVEKRQSLQDIETVRMGELVAEAVASKAAEIRTRSLHIKIEVPSALTVRGERFLLRQALQNLLDNAIAFSDSGGTIVIGGQERDGECELTIIDRGPGIPEYARERVFERFYSLPRPDTGRKSTGLGLSFVREVALLHRGSVQLDNPPQGGLAARLVLPAAPGP
jgi:two-component system sensor histidine kinase CreC